MHTIVLKSTSHVPKYTKKKKNRKQNPLLPQNAINWNPTLTWWWLVKYPTSACGIRNGSERDELAGVVPQLEEEFTRLVMKVMCLGLVTRKRL